MDQLFITLHTNIDKSKQNSDSVYVKIPKMTYHVLHMFLLTLMLIKKKNTTFHSTVLLKPACYLPPISIGAWTQVVATCFMTPTEQVV